MGLSNIFTSILTPSRHHAGPRSAAPPSTSTTTTTTTTTTTPSSTPRRKRPSPPRTPISHSSAPHSSRRPYLRRPAQPIGAGYDPASSFEYPAEDNSDYRPPSSSTHSFRRILVNGLSHHPQHHSHHESTGLQKPPPEPGLRRPRRPTNRIMSNIDQFIRRDQQPDRQANAPRRGRHASLLHSRRDNQNLSSYPDPVRKPRPVSLDLQSSPAIRTPLARLSADGFVPSREITRDPPRPSPPTNTTPSQSPARTSRRERFRPPPLVMPPSAAPINNVTPLPPSTRTPVPTAPPPTAPTPEPNPAPERPAPPPDPDELLEPKAYSKGNDMWQNDRDDITPLHANGRVVENDYLFEPASQSSFRDMETPSRIAARNGIVPINSSSDLPVVTEDVFRFGPDESFSDGGFIIWSNGLLEAPEKVMRKNSDGQAVDGVPPSSNNLIIVRSLDEFKKSRVLKNSKSSKDGSATLGRGAAGRVYLAVHEPSRRKIAVKEINFYDVEKRNQLKKELVTLISHQSRFLVRSFGAFYDGHGRVHVTLEYMDRGSLSDIVAARGSIRESVICKIAEHCLRGLCFLHHNHILHRDVKTGNILLSRKLCRAKLSDFGLARDLKEGSSKLTQPDGQTKSVTDTFVGTPAYMSPERLTGGEYTYASDVWALGISVIECALGKCPFDGLESYFDIVSAAQSSPAALVEGKVSRALFDFISAATARDPQQRPTARQLLDHEFIRAGHSDVNALRDWLDSLPMLHMEEAGSSKMPLSKKAEKDAWTKAKIRAKAEETDL